MSKNEPLYVSPIIYESLRKGKINNYVHDPIKSDVFSLGLVILEASL